MFHKLINPSPDLKRLSDEGYELEIKGGYMLVHHVPYVNAKREIKYGTLVSSLTLSGDKTTKPDNHVIYFIGEHPCNIDGTIIQAIRHTSSNQILDANHGITVNHSFSNKPKDGFNNYYEKITSYIAVISHHACALDESVKVTTFKVIHSTEANSVFKYVDTNSSRAEINNISSKLENLRIAIIGLGGTGSYVLDFLAKTSVKEIHLFDGDVFLQHNAFRAPGAASIEQLVEQPKKVNYFYGIYSKMRDSIFPHGYDLNALNVEQLVSMDFVFICIDDGETKRIILGKLLSAGIPFVDTGIGVQVLDGALTGSVRVTTGTKKKSDHISTRIPFNDDANNDYSKNIQIAELNALNAILAILRWKKLFGIYHDFEKEHNSVYEININQLMNDEAVT